MGDQHPLCPKCSGLLKHEPADILGPERVKCILCSWEMYRPTSRTPLRPPIQKQEPKPVNMPKPMPERKPLVGTCPSCKRPDVNIKHGGICGRCCYRKGKGIDVQLPNHKPGIHAPRMTESTKNTIQPQTKEKTMARTTGTCPVCKRPDRKMNGTKCPRCYSRIAKGLDPLTGKPAKAAPLAPAILADDEIDGVAPVSPAPAAGSKTAIVPEKQAGNDFNVDVLAAIDSAWLVKRDVFIAQLTAATKTADRLRIAFHTLATIQALGFEA